jgi:hypothetical protein
MKIIVCDRCKRQLDSPLRIEQVLEIADYNNALDIPPIIRKRAKQVCGECFKAFWNYVETA